jgi:PAS domain S-box-containing protein
MAPETVPISPAAGGVMGQKIRAFDWSKTPLGPVNTWSATLKVTVNTVLSSSFPMCLFWGADLIAIYNDGYAPILGQKPEALGEPLRVTWSEAWEVLRPICEKALAGESTYIEDALIQIDRSGKMEDAYFTFSYSPVRDEGGEIVGMLDIVTETTAKFNAQKELVQERERFVELFEQAPSFMAVLRGPEHRIEYTNPGYRQLIGHRPVMGLTVEEALPDAVAQGYLTLLDSVYQSGKPYKGYGAKYAVQAVPEGPVNERFVDFVYQPIFGPEGEITGIFLEGIDVTDRKEAEAAIAERDADFLAVAQSLPNHVWTAAPDGMVDWFNDRVYTYSGADAGELDGANWARIVHPDDIAAVAQSWADAVAAGETYETQFRIRRHDGVYRWHLVRALPLLAQNGQVRRWIGTNTDIETQASQLIDSRDFTRLALNATGGIGVWTFDIAEDRFYFDEAIASVYALAPESVHTGLKREQFLANVHPDDRTSLKATMSGGLTNAGDLELEYRIVHPDGDVRWVLSRGHTYFENGQPVRRTGVGVDMTDKRRLEEQLRQSQKMEAVGQLTGGIAHDFNNMLAVVMGSLELLNRRIGIEDPKSRHFVKSATDAAKRAANLTHRLLAFSRQQPLSPETIDPNKLVSGMSDLLRHSIGTDIHLETVLAGGMWRIEADPNQLENVILNLGVNARDAMPSGGKLTIETQNAHLDARYVSSEMGVPAGQYVMIAITDTGAGMSEEVIAKAFDPFFTTKAVGKGTGLGLSQVYGFVKQSGGHIKIYSELGVGTTIKLYLPRSDNTDIVQIQTDDVSDYLMADHREVIVVVDDEPAVRHFSAEALSELGYRVLEAENAADALRLIQAHPEIVLLFTDIVMPETNGRQLANEALRLRPDLKVLFTTGYSRNAVMHNGVLDKGVELLGKPFTLDELAAHVRSLLD